MKKAITRALVAAAASIACSGAFAGDIYLTGHDVDLHGNQNGYDRVILDYLRGSVAASSYRVGIVTGNVSSFTTFGAGYGSRVARDITSFTSASDFRSFLGTVDVMVVASAESCGGCVFSPADVALLNTFRPEVTTFFNAGGDIFGLTGANDAAYYGFLPPSAVATGAPISGSSGFTATAAGMAIGILPNMINGFQTHNRFVSQDPAFTVMETRGAEVISIGLRDGRIDDGGGIVIDPVVPGIPEPETYALMLAGLGVVGYMARRRKVA